MINTTDRSIEITLRIPANWEHPRDLLDAIPAGFRLMPETLVMPDGSEVDFTLMPPDDQFANIFASSCRRPATLDEMEIINNYTVNVGLTGPGGSLESANRMVQAGAAIIRAGGAGVFNDNSGIAHGGQVWLEMADDGSTDALSYAFVGIVNNSRELFTIGMHVLGRPDVVVGHSEDPIEDTGDAIIDIIRYLCATDRQLEVGHVIADLDGPRFKAVKATENKMESNSPMHNPWGQVELVSFKDIAQNN
jgi:hypothetical protein